MADQGPVGNHSEPSILPPIREIDATSRLRRPMQFLADIASDFASAPHLAWTIFRRDVAAQFRGAVLGIGWLVVQPIIATLALVLMSEAGVLNVGEVGSPYPVFVFTGFVLWQSFRRANDVPRQTLSEGKALLGRLQFPIESIFLAKLYRVLLTAAFNLATLVVVVFIYLPDAWPLAALMFPIVLISVLIAGMLAGLVIAPLESLFADFGYIFNYAITGWFFLTPVVYAAPSEGLLALIVAWNPMTPLIDGGRELILHATLTAPGAYLAVMGGAVILFGLFYVLFRLSLTYIVERSGA